MAAPFACDEKVTIQHDTGTSVDSYGAHVPAWTTLLDNYWANVQDILPSRAESTANGLAMGVQQSRLRMPGAGTVTATMRAVLHNRGDRVMQIIAGPALLDDRVHYEFMLEFYSTAGA